MSTSSYNIILGRHALNTLGVILSTLYMTLKYTLDNNWVVVIRGDHEVTRICYKDSLRLKIKKEVASSHNYHKVNCVDFDPRGRFLKTPIHDME